MQDKNHPHHPMKTSLVRVLTFGTLLLTFSLTSCVAPYGYGYGPSYGPRGYGGGYGAPPAQGAVTGALLGAAAGGIIGNQSRRGLEGAAIGGLLGAFAGGALQNSRQQRGYYGQSNCNHGYQGYGRSYGPPNYNQGYGYGQASYQPNYGYQSSNNPYAFGNWQ